MSQTPAVDIGPRSDAVDDFLFDWADEFDVPGVALAVVTPDAEAHTAAVGSRELSTNASATPDTLYAVGSVTKSFTATAVMQQAAAGALDLADSPAAYTDAAFDGVEAISLHDLLCHGSGLPSLAVSEGLIAQQTDAADPPVPIGDREDFYRYLNGAGDEVVDGDRFLYANSGYMLLADAVAEVADRPFDEVVTEDILEPLGMSRSTLHESAFETDDDTMTPYRWDDNEGRWRETPVPVRELSRGPGGLFTSVRELGAYLRMYLNDGRAADGTQVLEPSSIERMRGAHTETPAGPYGYGWRTVSVDGHEVVGHGGSVGVATAYAGWSTDLDLGVAVACNAAPGHGLRVLGEGVLHALLGNDPFVDQPALRRHRRQEALVGRYESYRGARTASVERAGGTLQLTLEEPLPLSPSVLVFDEATDAGYRYWTPTDDGRMPVEFRCEGENVELLYDRWRVDRTGPA